MDEHISLNVFMHYNKPMKNIIDYIKEYGNLTFEEYPFNNVDSLILSQISYIKFENSSIDIEYEIHLLNDFENEINDLCTNTRVPELNEELFLQMIHSLRYEAITISDFQFNFDKDNEKQFCAMTLHLPNQTDYIAFRGTDASFVGWKEDFNLCFQENIPSQISALNYVNNYKTNHKLILGGHSKGANLAYMQAYIHIIQFFVYTIMMGLDFLHLIKRIRKYLRPYHNRALLDSYLKKQTIIKLFKAMPYPSFNTIHLHGALKMVILFILNKMINYPNIHNLHYQNGLNPLMSILANKSLTPFTLSFQIMKTQKI